MNHRERVMDAVDDREADRLPVDLGGVHASVTSAVACAELTEYLGITRSSRPRRWLTSTLTGGQSSPTRSWSSGGARLSVPPVSPLTSHGSPAR